MRLIVLLFLLIIPLVSGSLSDQKRITDYGIIGTPVCYGNGAVEIRVTNLKDNTIALPAFIKGVGARYGNSTIDLKRYWYDREGSWYDSTYSKMEWTAGHGDEAIFISEEFLLNQEGEYTLRISGIPIAILDFVPKAVVYEFNFSCPGYVHACNPLKPRIEECFEGEEHFFAYFTGLGESAFSKINLTRDLRYLLNYQSFNEELGHALDLPSDHELHRLGNDRYLLKIPLSSVGESITSLRIEVRGCIEGFHHTSHYSSCGKKSEAIEREVVRKIIVDETIQETVIDLVSPIEEQPDAQKILRQKTKIEATIAFLIDLIPVQEGSLRRFLIGLGN